MAFPNVAFSSPPNAGPLLAESSAVASPINFASGIIAIADKTKSQDGENPRLDPVIVIGMNARRAMKNVCIGDVVRLNSPWAVVKALLIFGPLGGNILIRNLGDDTSTPTTRCWQSVNGVLKDTDGNNVLLPRLLALTSAIRSAFRRTRSTSRRGL